MIPISTIVEGHGEVGALPVLLSRLGAWRTPTIPTIVLPPIRVHRDRFLKRAKEFSRVIALAAAKSGEGGRIFILLDADNDCPAQLGATILMRAKEEAPHRHISVVLANREYEAWFIAAASSLHGHRGFSFDPKGDIINAESVRDAKGWIRTRMASRIYGETTDQPALSALIDLQQAFDGSRSFRKMCDEWRRAIGPDHPRNPRSG